MRSWRSRVISFAALTRVAVLAAGLLATVTIGFEVKPGRFRLSHNEFWNLPGRFDAGWYLGIARHGYRWNPDHPERQQNVVFFPAFPLLMRAAGEIVTIPAHLAADGELAGSNGDTRVVWGGALVAIACFVAACLLLVRLSEEKFGDAAPGLRAAGLLATYPFALYFSAPYGESLFLLSAIAACLAVERDRPLTAAAWGLLAGLTRSNGWALAPALFIIAASKPTHRLRLAIAAVAPAVGTLLFSAYVWTISGDFFGWAAGQRGWNREIETFGFLTRRIGAIAESNVVGYLWRDPIDAAVIVAVLFSIAGAVVAFRKLGPAYGVLSLVYLLPALVVDIPSIGRMTSVLFPSFLALAAITSSRQATAIALAWLPLQLWFAARFFTWQTPF